MEYFYDNNKLSMPEQVNKNTADIAELKKVTRTPAVMYNASVEIATDAGVVSQSDVIETVTTTDNSYIMDTVGSLFKVISIDSGNIYISYVASIKGPTGANGADGVGIQSITSVPPIQDDGYTVTPVTFTDTDGNQTTVNVRAKNGEYAQVDSALSDTSENPVQNKTITNAINITNFTELTPNTTYIESFSSRKSYWYKIGNIAIVHINNIVFKAVAQSNGDVLFSGLPRPVSIMGYNDYVFVLNGVNQQSRVIIDANTNELKNYYQSYTPNAGSNVSGVLIYPTID